MSQGLKMIPKTKICQRVQENKGSKKLEQLKGHSTLTEKDGIVIMKAFNVYIPHYTSV